MQLPYRLKYGILSYAFSTIFAQRLCTIVLYHLENINIAQLPMAILVSPDIFQDKMSELMAGLDFACAYLDDL
jgi:hypothetical protein